MQLTYDLEAPATNMYTLKVWGCNEYLVPTTLLSDYEYVHDCIKLDEDVVLILIPDSKKDKSFARTVKIFFFHEGTWRLSLFFFLFFRFKMTTMMRLRGLITSCPTIRLYISLMKI